MKSLLPSQMKRLKGFGLAHHADAYHFRPISTEEVIELLSLARHSNRKVVLRGAGKSYGDASTLGEAIAIDLTRMDRILDWNPATGILHAEAGVTIEQVWRHTLEDGWWPPVVSGTMKPTLAGAFAMNIHGKNQFRVGNFADHILEVEFISASGKRHILTPLDNLFWAIAGSAGLLGIVTSLKLQLKPVVSGDLVVTPRSCRDWTDQFEAFQEHESEADYMVSWIDGFARNASAGRGLFHAARHQTIPSPSSLRPSHQDLPDTILGLFPKSTVWRHLRRLNRRWSMKLVNAAKYHSAKALGNGMPHNQSLVSFSFLLDYVPNWEWAYLPGGLHQFQSFIPLEKAREVFETQIELAQAAGLPPFLAVMKRHRPDQSLLHHCLDGYSLALDFKRTDHNAPYLFALIDNLGDQTVSAGGRFYFAKDGALSPEHWETTLGDRLETFREWKSKLDPENLLTSDLAERLQLFEHRSSDPPSATEPTRGTLTA
jgi:decaprenylphospho-beta-D-ribofuranose 2-oxidase